MDFLCREDIAMKNFEEFIIRHRIRSVYDQLDEETKEDPLIFPSEATLEKCEVYKALDADTTAYYSQLWKELKTS